EILERLLRAGRDVRGGKHFAELVAGLGGPLAIQRRDLRRDGRVAGAELVLELLADHPLGMAGAVRQRGIEEGDALLDCFAQRLATLAVVHTAPHLAADPPGTEPDF